MSEKPFYDNPFDVKSPKVDAEVLRLEELHRSRVLESPSFREGLTKMINNLIEMNTLLSKSFATEDKSHVERCGKLLVELREEEKKLMNQFLSWGVRGKMATDNMRVLYRLERMSDMFESILHCCRMKIYEDVPFTDHAKKELDQLFGVFSKMLTDLRDALLSPSPTLREDMAAHGKDLMQMVEEFRTAHWKRIETGRCAPASSSLYRKILDSFKWGGEYIQAYCASLVELEQHHSTSDHTGNGVERKGQAHEIVNSTG